MARGYETDWPTLCEPFHLDRIDRRDAHVGIHKQKNLIPRGSCAQIAAPAKAYIYPTTDDLGAISARNCS
jgi:hypothetical protein